MVYLGSKRKSAKALVELMLSVDPEGSMPWVEPFCGGCNLIDHIPQSRTRIASDCNPYLIAMWKRLQGGWNPPLVITQETYRTTKAKFKADLDMSPKERALTGWIGFVASFKGKFMDSYVGNSSSGRDYVGQQGRNILKQLPNLQGVQFTTGSYDAVPIPTTPCIIYCDPPYQHLTPYRSTGALDYAAFWEWCRTQRARGHIVFVSECTAPPDFTSVWDITVGCELQANAPSTTRTEHLYTIV